MKSGGGRENEEERKKYVADINLRNCTTITFQANSKRSRRQTNPIQFITKFNRWRMSHEIYIAKAECYDVAG